MEISFFFWTQGSNLAFHCLPLPLAGHSRISRQCVAKTVRRDVCLTFCFTPRLKRGISIAACTSRTNLRFWREIVRRIGKQPSANSICTPLRRIQLTANCQASRIIGCYPQLNSSHCQTFSPPDLEQTDYIIFAIFNLLSRANSSRCKGSWNPQKSQKSLFALWKIQLKILIIKFRSRASGNGRNFHVS